MGRAFEYRKAAKLKRWGHMARTFTKLGKEIAIAVKAGGPEPENNPRLRAIIELIDYGVDDEFDVDNEEGEVTIYGEPTSFGEIQKHLEDNGFEITSAEFTRIPNDLKDVDAEERETIDKMVERLEDFDDVQNVYTNMKPAEE